MNWISHHALPVHCRIKTFPAPSPANGPNSSLHLILSSLTSLSISRLPCRSFFLFYSIKEYLQPVFVPLPIWCSLPKFLSVPYLHDPFLVKHSLPYYMVMLGISRSVISLSICFPVLQLTLIALLFGTEFLHSRHYLLPCSCDSVLSFFLEQVIDICWFPAFWLFSCLHFLSVFLRALSTLKWYYL